MSIGTDIEVVPKFLLDETLSAAERAGLLYDVLRRIGTKRDPMKLPNGQAIHADNIGVEFTTGPCSSAGSFADSILESLTLAEQMTGHRLVGVSHIDLGDVAHAFRNIDPWAAETIDTFGCAPDVLVFKNGNTRVRVPPRKLKRSTVREFGFHLHIDCFLATPSDLSGMVKGLDAALQEYMVDPEEASHYRKPSLIRRKPYGIEYRSLGADALPQAAEIYHRASDVAADFADAGY